MHFDGQQSDEKVLTVIRPHPTSKILGITKTVCICLLFYAMLFGVANAVPLLTIPLEFGGLIIIGIGMILTIWWIIYSHEHTKTYLTDRRVIRFETISPFTLGKRALFWNEVLKAKSFQTNLFLRLFGFGTVTVEPTTEGNENIVITDVSYYDDLANYIDKIIYTSKHNPEQIHTIKPFIAKPKGKRDA